MDFQNTLNQYMERLDITTRELAEASGLSAPVISRYRSGGRTPGNPSEQRQRLAEGIARLAAERGMREITYDSVLLALTQRPEQEMDAAAFGEKFDFIVRELNINVASLAKALSYDASFLSRLRAGNRMPADVALFVRKLCVYIEKNYSEKEIEGVADRICRREVQGKDESTASRLERFFLDHAESVPDQTSSFLHKLDDFDLNEYIRSVHFDELKVPTAPFQFHTTKKYLGVDGQKEGEIDFLKGAVLARSQEPVFMCSDMDMTDMAEDLEFSKKWMLGLAMLLKKNRELKIVHNLNRPFGELMLGLEAWIPLYMTGQVTPFYLKGSNSGMYQHLLYTSGTYALSGECIKGAHAQGRFVLTNNREEVAYYKARSECILREAGSLMDIYTADRMEEFRAFYDTSLTIEGNRHFISSSLPIFTLPESTLADFLEKYGMSREERERLLKTVNRHRSKAEEMVARNKLYQEAPWISKEEFQEHPIVLDLKEYGYYEPIAYGYEDYLRHLKECENYSETHKNYIFQPSRDFAFRNITIRIVEGEWVWISKSKAPMIHFVIHHPILRDAIEHMVIPLYDEKLR